jgi:nicotinamidase-related amidase
MINGSIYGSELALVVVDPQRKFTLNVPDWKERRDSAVKGINEFARVFRENGAPVIFIHFDGASHCDYGGDDGDECLEGIESSEDDIVIHKSNMSCFKDTDLEATLEGLGVDCAVYAGMLTEFCVVTTYFGSLERGVFPYMGRGALIPYNSKGNEAAEILCNTVEVPTVERFLKGEQPPMELLHH